MVCWPVPMALHSVSPHDENLTISIPVHWSRSWWTRSSIAKENILKEAVDMDFSIFALLTLSSVSCWCCRNVIFPVLKMLYFSKNFKYSFNQEILRPSDCKNPHGHHIHHTSFPSSSVALNSYQMAHIRSREAELTHPFVQSTVLPISVMNVSVFKIRITP